MVFLSLKIYFDSQIQILKMMSFLFSIFGYSVNNYIFLFDLYLEFFIVLLLFYLFLLLRIINILKLKLNLQEVRNYVIYLQGYVRLNDMDGLNLHLVHLNISFFSPRIIIDFYVNFPKIKIFNLKILRQIKII